MPRHSHNWLSRPCVFVTATHVSHTALEQVSLRLWFDSFVLLCASVYAQSRKQLAGHRA